MENDFIDYLVENFNISRSEAEVIIEKMRKKFIEVMKKYIELRNRKPILKTLSISPKDLDINRLFIRAINEYEREKRGSIDVLV